MGQLPYADMIGGLAVMGFGPSEIRTWSLWEYSAVVDGWNKAHEPAESKPEAPPIETLRAQKAAWAKMQERLQ